MLYGDKPCVHMRGKEREGEREREGGRVGGRERVGEREGGRESGRERGRERGRVGEREREGLTEEMNVGKEGGEIKVCVCVNVSTQGKFRETIVKT